MRVPGIYIMIISFIGMGTTMMSVLGQTVGAMFAKAATIFARKGNVSGDYDTLEKLEAFVKRLNQAVFDGTTENDLDTLAEISAFLTANKVKILAAGSGLAVGDVVDGLTSDDGGKVLSAKQGKVLKGLIDDVVKSVADCLKSANGYTDGKIGVVNEALSNLTAALSGKVNQADVYLKTEVGTTAEFTTAFNESAGNIYK